MVPESHAHLQKMQVLTININVVSRWQTPFPLSLFIQVFWQWGKKKSCLAFPKQFFCSQSIPHNFPRPLHSEGPGEPYCVAAEAECGARLSGVEFQVHVWHTVGPGQSHGTFWCFHFLICKVQLLTGLTYWVLIKIKCTNTYKWLRVCMTHSKCLWQRFTAAVILRMWGFHF